MRVGVGLERIQETKPFTVLVDRSSRGLNPR